MSGIDSFVTESSSHDDYDPNTDDLMMPALGGGIMLEGPGGEYVANAVETTPRVDSALGSAGTAVARGDGGVEEAIQTADELISRVSEVVEQDESVRTR